MDGATPPIYDVVVIGGGVVGCAVLRELSRYDLKLLLLEKEADLAEGISKGNSGVIHAGFNVPSGSLKAKTNVDGLALIYPLAAELGVPHRKTGKLVVALSDEDRPRLEELKAEGDRNGVPGLEIVDEAAIRRLEPLARGRWALYSPHTGIISPYELTIALAECAWQNGAEVRLETPVEAVAIGDGLFRLATPKGTVAARAVVNSAGLFADEVARPGRDRGLPDLSVSRRIPHRRQGLRPAPRHARLSRSAERRSRPGDPHHPDDRGEHHPRAERGAGRGQARGRLDRRGPVASQGRGRRVSCPSSAASPSSTAMPGSGPSSSILRAGTGSGISSSRKAGCVRAGSTSSASNRPA